MLNELLTLYNTLLMIETKGENTKTMSRCLQFIEQLIKKEQEEPTETVES